MTTGKKKFCSFFRKHYQNLEWHGIANATHKLMQWKIRRKDTLESKTTDANWLAVWFFANAMLRPLEHWINFSLFRFSVESLRLQNQFEHTLFIIQIKIRIIIAAEKVDIFFRSILPSMDYIPTHLIKISSATNAFFFALIALIQTNYFRSFFIFFHFQKTFQPKKPAEKKSKPITRANSWQKRRRKWLKQWNSIAN